MMKDINDHPLLKPPSAALILENGKVYWGQGMGAKTSNIGELCFNTSQTGYQEILTDPSYAKQIITFTFPHIGIVGTNNLDVESNKIHASGCILNQTVHHESSWRSDSNLDFFFVQNNTPCITNIDTRQLTRLLAEQGAIKAAIINFGEDKVSLDLLSQEIDKWNGLQNLDLASVVTTLDAYKWSENIWQLENNQYTKKNNQSFNITCLDFGIKQNILRNLINSNFAPTVLPSHASFDSIMKTNPDGIFLSNGPGDPFATGEKVIPVINKLIKKEIPIFGICLGHQILSLALGAKTKKMFQGHRGGNHPVKNLETSIVEITAQNHGFEVDRSSLPSNVKETHVSLFDGSNEGIKHVNLPIFSVQYHPEASPGPHDSHYLFDQFHQLIQKNA